MSLQTNLTNLATRMATECKSLRTLVNGNVAGLTGLTTTAKGSLLAAINDVQAQITTLSAGAAGIADGSTATTSTWSSSKVAAMIAAAKSELVNGAGTALDTLQELSAALGNDASFAATTATSLGNRVRFDAAQTLTAPQQAQACANIGVGDPETNFVTTFNAGLV